MRQVSCVVSGGLVAVSVLATAFARDPRGGAAAESTPGTPTCTSGACHLQVMQYRRLHQPVAANRCDACHRLMAGSTPFQAGPRHEFNRAGDKPELCYACHDRLDQEDFVHEPVKMGVCILCHDPHGAERSLLLRVDTDRELCGQCHRVTVDRGDHVHAPVSQGTCGACHHPHGSAHRKFLRAAPPELCLDCHDDIEELLDEATVEHDALTAERACLGCHDPHVAEFQGLLVGEPMDLCLSCHDREWDSAGGKIRNIAQDLKDYPDHHGPILDGNCSACHHPHGGTVFRLLTGSYPKGLYAPFDEDGYALCLDCHEAEMLEEERDPEATDFRNGDLNLHYVHVNRQDQGCTCGACHDVHAGKAPKHIAAPRPFGDRAILISFEPTATGGSCRSACHQVWAYDRVNPVRNP